MGRKAKISLSEGIKGLVPSHLPPKPNARAKRIYYLIVTEGQKTEPLYFEGLKNDLPFDVLTIADINIQGAGRNTLSLVKRAIDLKQSIMMQRNRIIDKVWVVFDRDSFSPHDFNQAIKRCADNSFGCAWSNESFELWYILHFNFYDVAMDRWQYKPIIEQHLAPHFKPTWKYLKNDPTIYLHLKKYGNQQQAIAHSKRLDSRYPHRSDHANQNPCTKVYLLVEELLALR